MGSIEKIRGARGDTFRAVVRRSRNLPRAVKLTKRFNRKTDATAWIRATEASLDRGEAVRADSRITLGETIARYIKEKLPHKSHRTQKLQKGQLNWFTTRFGELRINAIGVSQLSEMRKKLLEEVLSTNEKGEAQTRDSQTANRYFQVFANLLEVAKSEWNLIDQAPKLPKLREKPKPRPPLSASQLKALLDALKQDPDERLYLIALISMTIGARLGEVCALRWVNIDLLGGVIHFVENTKGDTPRSLPIPPILQGNLRSYRMRSPEDFVFPARAQSKSGHIYDWATKKVRGVAKKLGIPGCFHSLRHSVASMAINNGVSTRQTQELLGHRSVSTTEGYSHVHSENLRSLVNEIELQILGVKNEQLAETAH